MIYPVDGSAPTAVRGLEPAETPVGWTGDGRWLLVRTGDPPRGLDRVDPVTGRRERWMEARPSNPSLIGPTQMLFTPDGRGYVANYELRQMTLFLVEGLQ